jgi:hypothetical protein
MVFAPHLFWQKTQAVAQAFSLCLLVSKENERLLGEYTFNPTPS